MTITIEQIANIPAGAMLEIKTEEEIALGYFDKGGTFTGDGTLHFIQTKELGKIDKFKVYRFSKIEGIKVLDYKKEICSKKRYFFGLIKI